MFHLKWDLSSLNFYVGFTSSTIFGGNFEVREWVRIASLWKTWKVTRSEHWIYSFEVWKKKISDEIENKIKMRGHFWLFQQTNHRPPFGIFHLFLFVFSDLSICLFTRKNSQNCPLSLIMIVLDDFPRNHSDTTDKHPQKYFTFPLHLLEALCTSLIIFAPSELANERN